MFNEKKIHYLIVAALATSVSSDALAGNRNDVDDLGNRVELSEFEKGTPTRASSRTFSAATNLDTVRWNDDLVAVLPMLPLLGNKNIDAECCQHATSDACASAHNNGVAHAQKQPCSSKTMDLVADTLGGYSRGNRIDLGDGRLFELDSIRFDDGDFATTLVGSRSMLPVAVSIDQEFDITPSNTLAFTPNSNDFRWSYSGRLIDTQSSQNQYVEGTLPMKVQLTPDKLSVQIDAAAIAESLA